MTTSRLDKTTATTQPAMICIVFSLFLHYEISVEGHNSWPVLIKVSQSKLSDFKIPARTSWIKEIGWQAFNQWLVLNLHPNNNKDWSHFHRLIEYGRDKRLVAAAHDFYHEKKKTLSKFLVVGVIAVYASVRSFSCSFPLSCDTICKGTNWLDFQFSSCQALGLASKAKVLKHQGEEKKAEATTSTPSVFY